jgi:hypothetical protein
MKLLYDRLRYINLNAITKLNNNAIGVDFNSDNNSTARVQLQYYITYI